ncbi:PilW family protein [Rhodoferax sp. PAMC 29310]|uniref:PilW family protein n=1 Tax=Rhodoferax sp. PAMC 29310 TaxID=2822760 RepID=UPI001B33A9CF|nr:PilW family protein [Rhodoferax sp. PAMC 29310]
MNPLFIFKANQAPEKRLASQRGVSLIETMVGMGLGILVSLIIVQVWGNFESQKQRTVSGSSAQENGLLALTELEVDVRGAGAGLTDSAAFDCTSLYSYYETAGVAVTPIPAYSGGMGLVPIQIIDGGTGSDTLTTKRGSDFLGALPAVITNTMPSSSSVLDVNSITGFADGDVVLAVDSSTGKCTVMSITQVMGSALKLQHNPGGSTTYNPPTSFQNTNAWPAFSTGAKILKIGNLLVRSYTVNGSNQLAQTATSGAGAATTAVLAGDIVKLKAQYGIANVGSQDVNAWVNATAATGWNVLDSAKVKRIKAVRLVIVARSSQREGADVTSTCTNISLNVNNGPCAWVDTAADPAPLIDLSANADWKKYRYRVYQSVIPMRNVIWAGV